MPIYKGNTKVVKLYKGSTQIVKRYKGTDVIYSASRLPSAFQEVEYIESTGTQYIDSGVEPTNTTIMKSNISLTSTTGEASYGSFRDISNRFIVSISLALVRGYIGNSGFISSGITITENTFYDIELNANDTSIKVNNTSVSGSNTATLNNLGSIYLFGRNQNGTFAQSLKSKFRSCQIYDNSVLIRNFVPCYRKADNVAGLYDLVNGVFYTNAGTGTFIVGGNV